MANLNRKRLLPELFTFSYVFKADRSATNSPWEYHKLPTKGCDDQSDGVNTTMDLLSPTTKQSKTRLRAARLPSCALDHSAWVTARARRYQSLSAACPCTEPCWLFPFQRGGACSELRAACVRCSNGRSGAGRAQGPHTTARLELHQ